MTRDPRWIGQPLSRFEDRRLLHGHSRFLEDVEPIPNAYHAAIVRSPYPHALIKRIDTREATKVEGVVGVLTGEDVRQLSDPFPLTVKIPIKYFPIAVDRVRYVGEPVAVIVAENRYIAEDAAQRIQIEYDPLPAVVDTERAMDPGAPVLHPELGSNVAVHRIFNFGDYDLAKRQAATVVSGTFVFPKVSSTPLETYQVLANYSPEEDKYVIWSNFHGPFSLVPVIAKALRVPENRLRLLTPPDIGGSYGIKSGVYPYMALMALASKKLGVPVRWSEDRLEHLQASSSGADRIAYVEAAVSAEGKILGLRFKFVDNVGAYLRPPEPATLFRTHGNLNGPYDVKNIHLEAIAVMSNKAPTGLNRGYGGPQLYFALERIVDKIAQELGLDPADIRMRNLIPSEQMPYRTPSGGLYDSGDYPKAFEKALELIRYKEWRSKQASWSSPGKRLGIGIAMAVEPSGSNMGYVTVAEPPEVRVQRLPKSGCVEPATVAIDPGGGITVRLSSLPQGQGHETVAAQVVAEVFDVDPSQVNVIADMDTHTHPWTISSGSYSSRFAPLTSSAVFLAARRLKERLRCYAAYQLGIPLEKVDYEEGYFFDTTRPETRISLRRVAGAVHWHPLSLPEGVEPKLEETVFFSMREAEPPDLKDRVDSSVTYGFVCEVAVVEVDVETGGVRILDYASVHDAGRLLNPKLANGQIYGGALHGIAAALFEELRYSEEGQLLTATFMDYPCPTAVEAPRIKVAHIESPSPLTPLGAKGLGEGSTMTAPPAIANAVTDALRPFGAEVNQLPITPYRLWELIHQRISAVASAQSIREGK